MALTEKKSVTMDAVDVRARQDWRALTNDRDGRAAHCGADEVYVMANILQHDLSSAKDFGLRSVTRGFAGLIGINVRTAFFVGRALDDGRTSSEPSLDRRFNIMLGSFSTAKN